MEGARQIPRQKTIDDFINEDDPITAYPGESIFDIHQFATERLDDELESYKIKKEASDASKEAVNRMFQEYKERDPEGMSPLSQKRKRIIDTPQKPNRGFSRIIRRDATPKTRPQEETLEGILDEPLSWADFSPPRQNRIPIKSPEKETLEGILDEPLGWADFSPPASQNATYPKRIKFGWIVV